MSLVRKELIRPDQGKFAGDDGFRFVHALVQDAAYGSMAKELRADLHERFAAWLEQVAGERAPEYEEMLGYHLEQAYRYRADLGPVDDEGRALAGRASERLAAGAQRALNRGDWPAQINLISRAVVLLPSRDVRRAELAAELGYALAETGEVARAEAVLGTRPDVVLDEAVAAAIDLNDARVEARARVARAALGYHREPNIGVDLHEEAMWAIRALEEANDELGLARAWGLVGWWNWERGQSTPAEEAFERCMEYARRAGSRRDELWGLARMAWIAFWGQTHRVDARKRCEEILELMNGDLEGEADVLGTLGCLAAIEGRFDEARARHAQQAARYEAVGLSDVPAWVSQETGWVEILAGDPEAAERLLRDGFEVLERMGAKGQKQAVGVYLAQAAYLRGKYEEAERVALESEELDPFAIGMVTVALCARAKAVARLGRADEGEQLARKAVALIDQTDFLIDRGDARMDLAEVLHLSGRFDEARELLREALQLHEQKGNLVSAERVRELLVELERS
jgi:tetratricopeptide (TPR) repeat protein